MKKADNFNPGKWLVENKITTQSRLNEYSSFLDTETTERMKASTKKAAEEYALDYSLKNNLGSIESLDFTGYGSNSTGGGYFYYIVFFTSGKYFMMKVIFDDNYNITGIEPDKLSRTSASRSTPIPSKIPGVKVSVDDNDVTFSSKSGDYDAIIEDDGTIRLDAFFPDMEEDEEEINNDNWKNILGPNHMFVKIANSIPTEVDTEGDAVAITFKASDLIK